MSPILKTYCYSLGRRTGLVVVCLALCGCQSWQLSEHLPGSGLSKKEKQIVDRVANDPFPTPEQVGIETE